MTALRSSSDLRPTNAILLPFTTRLGIGEIGRRASPHSRRARPRRPSPSRRSSLKPSSVPAVRPTTPVRFGPTRFFASGPTGWQAAHRLKTFAPAAARSASWASRGCARGSRERRGRAKAIGHLWQLGAVRSEASARGVGEHRRCRPRQGGKQRRCRRAGGAEDAGADYHRVAVRGGVRLQPGGGGATGASSPGPPATTMRRCRCPTPPSIRRAPPSRPSPGPSQRRASRWATSCACSTRSPTPPLAPRSRRRCARRSAQVRPAATMVVAGLNEPEMKVEIEVTAFRG